MTFVRSDRSGVSPVLGVVILVIVTVALSMMAATLIFDFSPSKGEEEVTGVQVTFSEDNHGAVNVRLISIGTADSVWVHTNSGTTELTQLGDNHQVSPGDGTISIIAESNGFQILTQTYHPQTRPDSTLIADAGSDQQKPPGSSYTFDASASTGNIDTYHWDLDGDGTNDATGEVISHSYPDPGVYTVTLTVETPTGETHTNQTTVRNTHLIVADDGSGDHTTIQSAIDSASSGWSILIKDGRYPEAVTVDKPNLNLFTNGAPRVNGSTITGNPGLNITATDVTVRGLHVTEYPATAGIRVAAPNTVLTSVSVTRSGVDEETGAITATRTADNLQIKNSRISANTGCGVVLGDPDAALGGPVDTAITTSIIHSSDGFGLCALATTELVTIENTNILYNANGGILLHGAEQITLRDTLVRGNGLAQTRDIGALHAYAVRDLTIRTSTIENNFNHAVTMNDVEIVSVRNTSLTTNEGFGLLLRGRVENDQLSGTLTNLAPTIQGVSNMQVTDSNISRNHKYGAYLNSTEDLRFENISFLYNGNTSDTSTEGVYLQNHGSQTVNNTTIIYSRLYGSGLEDIHVDTKGEDADATQNWWGQASGPAASQYGGSVAVDPYCTVEDCSDHK